VHQISTPSPMHQSISREASRHAFTRGQSELENICNMNETKYLLTEPCGGIARPRTCNVGEFAGKTTTPACHIATCVRCQRRSRWKSYILGRRRAVKMALLTGSARSQKQKHQAGGRATMVPKFSAAGILLPGGGGASAKSNRHGHRHDQSCRGREQPAPSPQFLVLQFPNPYIDFCEPIMN
jgi:hypothetical protein